MNGIDYTKQLAKDREYYRDASEKQKAATDKRIADIERRSEHVNTKQRENFIQDRAELESGYQKSLNDLKDTSKTSLQDSSSKFNKDMEQERKSFTEQSLKKSQDFDRRLSDLKSSYGKAFDSEKDFHRDLTTTQQKKYRANVDKLTSDNSNQMKDYQDKMSKESNELKHNYGNERQDLTRSYEDRMTGLHKANTKKNAELREGINSEMRKQKEVHSADLKHQQDYAQDRLGTMQKNYQERFDTMAKDYGQRTDNLVDAQKNESIKTNREHQQKITDANRGYNDHLREIEREKRRRDNGNGEFAEIVDRQQGLKDKIIHENRERSLETQLSELQRTFSAKSIHDEDAFNQTLKEESSEAVARQDRKLNEANADKIVTVSKERERAEAEVSNREHQNRLDRSAYEQQLMLEKNNSNERITKLKENFNSSMKTLEDKHRASLEDVTKTSNKDKNEYIKKVQERRSNEIFEMKREFGKMMDSTVQDYEARLSKYQRENEYLKLTMDQKVQNIIDQTQKNLDTQRTLFEDRRAADVKGHQLLMDQREAQLKRNMTEVTSNFQRKLDKLQVANDSKLKLLTNDYENKLKELKATTSKDLAQKDMNHQTEQDRIKQAFDDEKARLVSSYENQIQGMKNGHKEAMDQMKDYKRLS